jgi:hypothetical protein
MMVALLWVLISGSTCHRADVTARLGEPVTLRRGQWASFSRRPLQIAFLRVVEDSRCPRNVQCVRAGDAVIQFQSTSAEGGFGSFLASLPGDAPPDSIPWATWSSYRLHLLRLDPYPQAGVAVDSSAFVVTFVVEKG